MQMTNWKITKNGGKMLQLYTQKHHSRIGQQGKIQNSLEYILLYILTATTSIYYYCRTMLYINMAVIHV